MLNNRKYDSTNESFTTPFKGPYRILKFDGMSVNLEESRSGNIARTFIGCIRPISTLEFRLNFLNHIFMSNKVKTKQVPRSAGSMLEAFSLTEDPYSANARIEVEMEVGTARRSSDKDQNESGNSDNSEKKLKHVSFDLRTTTINSLEDLHKCHDAKGNKGASAESETSSKLVRTKDFLTRLFK